MCTLSVICTRDDVVRLAFNRDELRTRPRALLPRVVTIGDRQVVMPIDPQPGGTWIAANDAGLAMALLNVNQSAGTRAPGAVSRGRIIPRVTESADLEEARRSIPLLRVTDYSPFRLIVLDREDYLDARSDGRALEMSRHSLSASPLIFTSSGLGDELVQRPRRALFEGLIDPHAPTPAMQDAFHAHHWPARPELSVMMSRDDASTVSTTLIELRPDTITLCYDDRAHERGMGASPMQIALMTHGRGAHATWS